MFIMVLLLIIIIVLSGIHNKVTEVNGRVVSRKIVWISPLKNLRRLSK